MRFLPLNETASPARLLSNSAGEPPLDVWKRRQGIVCALHHTRGAIDPTPCGHVDDRVVGPDDAVAAGELTVEYAIVALRFAAISVDGLVEAVRGRKLEMHCLSREGPEACSEEEKPRQELTPVGRLSEEAACLMALELKTRASLPSASTIASVGIDGAN